MELVWVYLILLIGEWPIYSPLSPQGDNLIQRRFKWDPKIILILTKTALSQCWQDLRFLFANPDRLFFFTPFMLTWEYKEEYLLYFSILGESTVPLEDQEVL